MSTRKLRGLPAAAAAVPFIAVAGVGAGVLEPRDLEPHVPELQADVFASVPQAPHGGTATAVARAGHASASVEAFDVEGRPVDDAQGEA